MTATVAGPPVEAERENRLSALASWLERSNSLDGAMAAVARALPHWLTSGRTRELLAGRWLGHSLHPLMTDFPLGFWASASLLDLVGDHRHALAARRLVGLGLVTSLPTAAAGLSDWSKLGLTDRRVGLVHAQLNGFATLCYGASYLARLRQPRSGIVLGIIGGLAATAGGYLGGHLSLTRAVTRDNRLLTKSERPDELSLSQLTPAVPE